MIDFLHNVAELTGLPFEDCFGGYRYIVLCGRACYVMRHKGVKTFSDSEIVLRINKKDQLFIRGNNLTIKHLSRDDAMVIGEILSVECVSNA